jgi:hypothetical protein
MARKLIYLVDKVTHMVVLNHRGLDTSSFGSSPLTGRDQKKKRRAETDKHTNFLLRPHTLLPYFATLHLPHLSLGLCTYCGAAE